MSQAVTFKLDFFKVSHESAGLKPLKIFMIHDLGLNWGCLHANLILKWWPNITAPISLANGRKPASVKSYVFHQNDLALSNVILAKANQELISQL